MKFFSKNNQNGFIGLVAIVIVAVVIIGGAIALVFLKKSDSKPAFLSSADITNPPKFIQADFIDLSKIYSISKFRSGEGHDFSGNGETCRSMKHYFNPQVDITIKPEKAADGRSIPPQPNGKNDIDIFSPVDGKITDIQSERMPVGEQIYIQPTNAKDYTIRLFHVYKTDGIAKGTTVKAGQKIGVISAYSTTDISVEGGRDRFISYFQVMPDNLFEAYKKRGATKTNDFIISKADRDAHPIPCNQSKDGDQGFQYPDSYDHEADNVRLSGYIKPDYTKAQEGQHNLN